MMMSFAIQNYGIHTFRAKIGETNKSSLNLFRKLGFQDVSSSDAFKEVTLELPVTELSLGELPASTGICHDIKDLHNQQLVNER